MSMRYKGGVISATPPTTSTTSAVGVWTLAQQLQAQGAGNWPTILSDQYFKYVTMLLHGDGTNGAQNNTFLDSSTNNFTITRNGNTTQGSFSPYGSNWSVNFPDSGSNNSAYISASISGALATTLQGSAQTREMWLFRTNSSSSNIAVFRLAGSDVGTIYFSGGNLVVYNGSAIISVSAATYVPIGVWTHIAVTLSGGVVTLWINGTSVGTASGQSFSGSSGTLTLGGASDMQSVGYISNMRVSNTARYSATFTPSTTPFTSDANTTLLCFQSNRFIDTSGNNIALTITVGTPSIQRFSPFSPSAAYSTSVIGGRGYFDGSGDYLSGIGTTSSFNFMHNSTALFTAECWVYVNSLSSIITLFDNNNSTSAQTGVTTQIYTDGTVNLFITYGSTGNNIANITTTGTVKVNQWTHIAFVYDQSLASNNGQVYINGVLAGSGNKSGNTPSSGNASNAMRVGCYGNGTAQFMNGYISDLRIVNAKVYTSAFTPPTAPLTAIANTSLLTNFTNGGIYDNAMMNNLETVGNAQISTSVVKFGSGSLAFDGTGDYLSVPATPNGTFGTGDFTIEGWIYPSSLSSNKGIFASSTERFGLIRVTNTLYWLGSPDINGNGAALTSNTWQHFAACRASGTLRLFLNGVQVGSGASTQSNAQSVWYVGSDQSNEHLDGYIDDLRITKGYARYTSNFTPPTAAFPNQ